MIYFIYSLSFILSPPFADMFIEWKHEMSKERARNGIFGFGRARKSQKMKEGGGFLPLLPTLSPLTRAALKHTTRPACNKAASQCCLSLKRFVVVLAGFATFFTSNYVSKCFNGFDRRRKIHLYVDERKTGQEH